MTGPHPVHYSLPLLLRLGRSPYCYAALLLALFIVMSKAAYQASFSDDDLASLALMQGMSVREWWNWLLTPRLSFDNIRPVGQAYYGVLGRWAGLHYGPYVAVLQALHLATAALLWRWLRPMGLLAAGVGALLFATHAAILAAYWKPMYIFDVLCGLLVMATLLLYRRGHWILAFVTFWLAYKAKEIAIAVPVALTLYEALTTGLSKERSWRLAPFYLAAVSFGLQALAQPQRPNHDYDLHLSAGTVLASAVFYAGKSFFLPFSGFILLILPFLAKPGQRRQQALFGIALFSLLLAPMLVFPGRLQGTYLYGPMLGAAMILAVLPTDWRVAALLMALWLPVDYWQVREGRRDILRLGHENGPYVTQVRQALQEHGAQAVLYDGMPGAMGNWGVDGLIHVAAHNPALVVQAASGRSDQPLLHKSGTLVLQWNDQTHKLWAWPADALAQQPPLPAIDFATEDPLPQLVSGWFSLNGGFRWTEPDAVLRLGAGNEPFGIEVNVAAQQSPLHETLRITGERGQELLRVPLDKAGVQVFTAATKSPFAGGIITLHVEPFYVPQMTNAVPLGVLVGRIGSGVTREHTN